ncbi:MAG: DegT/DnrJ/EryC1/StrS family aminotransferase [Rhodospirillales bacterium]
MNANVPWWRTQLDEREADAARDAILAGKLSQGPITAELEESLAKALNVPFVTMTTSGSSALVSALVAAGVGPGDEVIVPNRTFIATAHAVQLIGATVRLADTLMDRPLIDPEQVEAKVNSKTRAILPVHVNGGVCDMAALRDIADRHGLKLIEDTAQGLFSKQNDKFLGTIGDYGCYSFGVTKVMTTGQGGFVVTHDEGNFEKLQRMRFHGVSSPRQGSFEHFGFNFRYTDFQAAVALQQLKRIPEKIKSHRDLYTRYREALAGNNRVRLQYTDLDIGELPLWNQVMCEDRQALVEHLTANGVGTMNTTPNLNASPHLSDKGPFPNSDRFQVQELILPSGPDQDPAQIDRVLEALASFETH